MKPKEVPELLVDGNVEANGSDVARMARDRESLRSENARLQDRLKEAELILDVQRRASRILGIPVARS